MNRPTGMWVGAGVLGLLLIGPAQAELAIIAHPDNPEPALTLNQVKRLYLAKSNSFPQGGKARRADQEAGSPAYREFLEKVLKSRKKQLDAYWSKMTFTGRGIRPETVGGDAEVKAWVKQRPEGIGYIDLEQIDEQVKVMLIIP